MDEIARLYWKEDMIVTTVDGSNNETLDVEAIEVQRLLLNDTTIIGDVVRSSFERGRQNEKDRSIFRFQDETWQDLYKLVHSGLVEVCTRTNVRHPLEADADPAVVEEADEEAEQGSDTDDSIAVEYDEQQNTSNQTATTSYNTNSIVSRVYFG